MEQNIIKKQKHANPTKKWRKQVLQNAAIPFRPTNQVALFLNGSENKSLIINKALEFYKEYIEDTKKIMDDLSLKFPGDWRYINRKNGKHITAKCLKLKQICNKLKSPKTEDSEGKSFNSFPR